MPPTKSWTLKQHPTCLSDAQKFTSQIADLTARLEKLEKANSMADDLDLLEKLKGQPSFKILVPPDSPLSDQFAGIGWIGHCAQCSQPLESCTCPPGV